MKRLPILLTLWMSFMLFTGVKATNFVEFSPSTNNAPRSITAPGLGKYWGFSDQAFRPRFTEQIRVLNWGQETGWWDDSLVMYDTDTIPSSMPLTVSSSYTYSIRVVAQFADEYCNKANPPTTDSQVYAFIQSTGSTPYYYRVAVLQPDCNAPSQQTLTGTLPAGTYKVSIVCSGWAIGSAWW